MKLFRYQYCYLSKYFIDNCWKKRLIDLTNQNVRTESQCVVAAIVAAVVAAVVATVVATVVTAVTGIAVLNIVVVVVEVVVVLAVVLAVVVVVVNIIFLVGNLGFILLSKSFVGNFVIDFTVVGDSMTVLHSLQIHFVLQFLMHSMIGFIIHF